MESVVRICTDPFVMAVGCAAAATQVSLRALCRSELLPDGPWKQEPGFTAHQLICLPFMAYMTFIGTSTWFGGELPGNYSTPDARVLATHATGLMMAKIIFATQVFWDIPTGLLVPSLREPLMLAHHVGMMSIALMNLLGLWQFYAPFFYGVIEVSGVVLSFVDVFHPKHKSYCDWLATQPRLTAFNDGMRALFFLLYMGVRACYFPWVVFSHIVGDALAVFTMPLSERRGLSTAALCYAPVVGVAFALLQLYWARLLTKQVIKVLTTKPTSSKKQL